MASSPTFPGLGPVSPHATQPFIDTQSTTESSQTEITKPISQDKKHEFSLQHSDTHPVPEYTAREPLKSMAQDEEQQLPSLELPSQSIDIFKENHAPSALGLSSANMDDTRNITYGRDEIPDSQAHSDDPQSSQITKIQSIETSSAADYQVVGPHDKLSRETKWKPIEPSSGEEYVEENRQPSVSLFTIGETSSSNESDADRQTDGVTAGSPPPLRSCTTIGSGLEEPQLANVKEVYPTGVSAPHIEGDEKSDQCAQIIVQESCVGQASTIDGGGEDHLKLTVTSNSHSDPLADHIPVEDLKEAQMQASGLRDTTRYGATDPKCTTGKAFTDTNQDWTGPLSMPHTSPFAGSTQRAPDTQPPQAIHCASASSSISLQEPSIVADIPPLSSPPQGLVSTKVPCYSLDVQYPEFLPSPLEILAPSSPDQKQSKSSDVSQCKDAVMAQLKAIKMSSIQSRNIALQDEIAKKRAKLQAITTGLKAPASETVKRHIKLLHDYNDIRDIGQGLIGMIADNRGVRIAELYEEFGVDTRD